MLYFLSSMDSVRFEKVRECLFVKRVLIDTGKEAALIKLDPPVIGQPWEIAVLFFELLQLPNLSNAHPRELLLPPVERLLAHTQLPANFSYARAALGLPQSERDLLLRKS